MSVSISACLSIDHCITENDLILKSINEAVETVSFSVNEKVDKDRKIAVHNLNEGYMESSEKTYCPVIEDQLITMLIGEGFSVVERNKSVLEKTGRSDIPHADYVLAYRVLKCRVEIEKGLSVKTITRKAVTGLNIRLIDAETGNIVWAASVDVMEYSEISRRLMRQQKLEEKKENSGLMSDEIDDRLISDEYIGEVQDVGIGVSNWLMTGIGFTEWNSMNVVFEGGVGYRLTSQITVGLNMGVYPHSRKLEGDYEETFKGIVLPVYISGKTSFLSYGNLKIDVTAGGGPYIYTGKLEIPDSVIDTIAYLERDDEISATEVAIGYNAGLYLELPVNKWINLNTSLKYHYTGHEYGESFQCITLGINYQF